MLNHAQVTPSLKLWVIVLISLLMSVGVRAQEKNAERGLGAHSYLSNEFDHVNLYNGNLSLTVPIGQTFRIGGELEYKLTLVYNSFVWDYKQDFQPNYGQLVQASPQPHANAGLGWMLSLGELYPPNSPPFNEDRNNYLYVAPDGSKYKFEPGLNQDGPTSSDVLHSFDEAGELMRLTVSERKIEFGNGVTHYFGHNYFLSRIEDRHGNKLIVDTTTNHWTLREECATCAGTTVRQHQIEFASGRVSKVKLSAFERPGNAEFAEYVFNYDVKSIPRDDKDTWVRSDNQITVPLLTSVKLPADAGFYTFTYQEAIRQASGCIQTATLPTRGHYTWSYTPYEVPINRPRPECPAGCADYQDPYSRTQGVYQKEIRNLPNGGVVGTVQYQIRPPEFPPHTYPQTIAYSIVRSTDGDDTVNYFNVAPDDAPNNSGYDRWDHGLPFHPKEELTLDDNTKVYLSREYFKGPAITSQGLPGEKLRSVYVRFEGGPGVKPRLAAQKIVYNDTGAHADTYYKDWNGLGRFRTVETGGSFQRGNVRTVTTNYSDRRPGAGEPWILNTYTQEVVTEGSQSATTQFCFDAGTGLLKRKRKLKGAGVNNADMLIEYVRDGDGNVVHEKYFGGDESHNAPVGDICSDSLTGSASPEYQLDHTYKYGTRATSKYLGSNFYTLWNDIDQNTGLVKESREAAGPNAAGLKTTFEYDELGRILKKTPGGSDTADPVDAATEYVYTPASGSTKATAEVKRIGASGILTRSTITFDNFGRPAGEQDALPRTGEEDGVATNSSTSRETIYTASGRKSSISTFGDTAKLTSFGQYDPFNRVGRITTPDARVATFLYQGVEKIEKKVSIGTGPVDASGRVTETVASTVEFYDRQGRLSEVREGSGPGNSGITTRYDYDVEGRLTEVAIKHDPSKEGGESSTTRVNVARTGTVTSSPSVNGNFPAAAAINGDRKGVGWGSGQGGWNDNSENEFSQDWLRVDFSGRKAIWRIRLYTLRSNFAGNRAEPTETETFSTAPNSSYGITDFEVQYWRDVAELPPMWRTIPGGKVTGSNKVMHEFILPATGIVTTKIRVVVHKGSEWTTQRSNYSRLVELEAFEGSTNVAASARGAQATASSCVSSPAAQCTNDPAFPPSAVIDGDRTGANWGQGGQASGWNDGTENEYSSDWLQVQFNGVKHVDEINVFTLQDNYANPSEPTFNMIFNSNNDRGYGITDYEVQYWDSAGGGRWRAVPGGRVIRNSNVWRNFRFPAIATDKIRVVVHGSVVWTTAPMNWSRIVEVEAFQEIGIVTEPVRDASTGWQVREFRYDNRGFLYAERHPEMGLIPGTLNTTEYKYDSMGRITQKRDARFTLRYEYDSAGRIIEIADTRNTEGLADDRLLKHYGYYGTNAAGDYRLGRMRFASRHNWIKNPFHDSFPNVAEMDIQIKEEYAYTGRGGRLGQRNTEYNSANATPYSFEQKFHYNELGNLSSQEYPKCLNATCAQGGWGQSQPRTVNYSYDAGYLERVGAPGSPSRYGELGYHSNKMLGLVKHKYGNSVEVSDVYAVADNNMSRPRSVTFSGNGIFFASGEYKYDGAGNIVKIGADNFYYDHVSRLTEATAGEAPAAGKRLQRYTYDPLGNMKTIMTYNSFGAGVGTMELSVDADTNRLKASILYDDSGNVTGSNTVQYTYDQFNMQTSAPNFVHLYGPSDERMWTVDYAGRSTNVCISDIIDRVTLRGLNREVLREYQVRRPLTDPPPGCVPNNPDHRRDGDKVGNWTWQRDYIYSGERLLASESLIGVRAYHLDHLGTPRRITKLNATSNGVTVTGAFQYLPFGEEALATGPEVEGERLKFTGHERDGRYYPPGHLLDYMHSRYYTAPHARFLSVDPAKDFKMTEPQSWNLYSYVRNNPMKYVDKSGGYREDFHFDLTYMLARAAGYSKAMAMAVATGTYGVDQHPLAHPFASFQSQMRHHFTTPEQRERLFNFAQTASRTDFESAGPAMGAYLHALQDTYSHAGFIVGIGHFFRGIAPDEPMNDPEKALRAARATYNVLLRLRNSSGLVVPWETIEPYVLDYLKEKEETKARQRQHRRLAEMIEAMLRDTERNW